MNEEWLDHKDRDLVHLELIALSSIRHMMDAH